MANVEISAEPQVETESDEVAFDYVKSSDFRVVWADGLMGGPTPQGHIHFALYAERPAIPRRVVQKLDVATGLLGPIVTEKMVARNAYVREMSCDVMMTPDVARSVGEWLIEQAKTAKGEEKIQ